MAAGNTHPITGSGVKGWLNDIIKFFTGNPIFAFLCSLFFLGLILPPRTRKYRRKKSGNPGRMRKSKSAGRRKSKKKTGTLKIVGRKRLKKAGLINNPGNPQKKKKGRSSATRAARVMPARFKDAKKGTPLMDEKMKWLRSKR